MYTVSKTNLRGTLYEKCPDKKKLDIIRLGELCILARHYNCIISTYFKAAAKEAGLSGATSTAYWGYANSFATLLISILAPILGTVADYKGFKNVFHILLWTRYRIYKYVSSRSNLSVVLIARVLYARLNRLCWSKHFL